MGRFLPGCVHLWLTFETPANPGPQNSRGCKGVIRYPGTARLCPFHSNRKILFPQTELVDDRLISRAILTREIFQQLVSAAHQLQQSAPGGVILFVRVEMLSKLIDSRGQKRDLHFGGPGIFIVNLVLANDLLFLLGRYGHLKFLPDTRSARVNIQPWKSRHNRS
jgi:hypothetical protein